MSSAPPDSVDDLHKLDAEALTELAASNPDELAYQRRLGWVHYGAGGYEEAAQVFRSALTRFSTDVELMYGLGMALKKVGKKEAARQAFENALGELDDVADDTRRKMLGHFARQHVHHLEHGSWAGGPDSFD